MRSHVNLYKGEKKTKASTSSRTVTDSRKMDIQAAAADDDDNDDDDEKVKLSELLDEMMLSGTETNKIEDTAGDSILTAEQASAIAGLYLPTTGFEAADFVATDYNFT